MQAVVKILAVVVNLANVLRKLMNQFIQKHHQNQLVILIIQMNIMKMIFLQIYQLQWTLKNQNNDDQWIQRADQVSDILTATDFSPINTPGPVDCVSKDSKPHDYFLHFFRKEFLDTVILIGDTNLYAERKITSSGNLGSSSPFRKWKPTNCEELLAFFGLTVNMGLINKSNINAYWNIKDWSQSTPVYGAVFTRVMCYT